MALELLIFDCDGTLLRTADVKVRAFAHIGSLYSREASETMAEWQRKQGGVNRSEKFARMFREVLGREITPEESKNLSKEFYGFCIDELRKAPLMPGVTDVLEAWKGKIPIYVASGAPQAELEELLENNGLTGYFTGIYGSPPAKAELLRRIIKESGASSFYTVMVGDSQADLDAAQTVDARFYGVGENFEGTGLPRHEDLTRLNAWLQEMVAE